MQQGGSGSRSARTVITSGSILPSRTRMAIASTCPPTLTLMPCKSTSMLRGSGASAYSPCVLAPATPLGTSQCTT
eukprot:11355230-Alexandrium_andersonii.AAC.1